MNKEENTLIKKYINLLKKINNDSNNKKKDYINKKIKLINNLLIKYNNLNKNNLLIKYNNLNKNNLNKNNLNKNNLNKNNLNKNNLNKKQKGGENIGYIAGDLFKSFFYLGKEVFNEIDSLTKLPGKLSALPDTKVTSKPTPPVAYKNPDIPTPVIQEQKS
jgi:hypothetical protein